MKKIFIIGAHGMLGHLLSAKLSNDFDCTFGIRKKKNIYLEDYLNSFGRLFEYNDLLNFSTINDFLSNNTFDYVINCVGVVKQKTSDKDKEIQVRINSLLPIELQKLSMENDFKLIHFSTDCVFNGNKGNYSIDDVSDAYDVYGKSKFLGEVEGNNSLTIRTSIIGHELNTKIGLLEWFLSESGKTVNGFNSCYFSGYTTNELSNFIKLVLNSETFLNGIHQFPSHRIDKYSLLKLINEVYQTNTEIRLSNQLKIDRSLVGNKLHEFYNYKCPNWKSLILTMFQEYNNNQKFYENHK